MIRVFGYDGDSSVTVWNGFEKLLSLKSIFWLISQWSLQVFSRMASSSRIDSNDVDYTKILS